MTKLTRRDFLKKSATAGAALALGRTSSGESDSKATSVPNTAQQFTLDRRLANFSNRIDKLKSKLKDENYISDQSKVSTLESPYNLINQVIGNNNIQFNTYGSLTSLKGRPVFLRVINLCGEGIDYNILQKIDLVNILLQNTSTIYNAPVTQYLSTVSMKKEINVIGILEANFPISIDRLLLPLELNELRNKEIKNPSLITPEYARKQEGRLWVSSSGEDFHDRTLQLMLNAFSAEAWQGQRARMGVYPFPKLPSGVIYEGPLLVKRNIEKTINFDDGQQPNPRYTIVWIENDNLHIRVYEGEPDINNYTRDAEMILPIKYLGDRAFFEYVCGIEEKTLDVFKTGHFGVAMKTEKNEAYRFFVTCFGTDDTLKSVYDTRVAQAKKDLTYLLSQLNRSDAKLPGR